MLQVFLLLVFFGLVLYLINTYIPMQPPFKAIVNAVAVIILLVWLFNVFGLSDIAIPVRRR